MEQKDAPPGYRFKPTDDELVSYYLMRKAMGRSYGQGIIADVDVYKFDPTDLPGKSALLTKDREWYFFTVPDKKYHGTSRTSRSTAKGYWKATGNDRKINNVSGVIIGFRKSLVYYEGRAPKGCRTNWIMHEYRLDEEFKRREKIVSVAVLCRIREKRGLGPRNGEQYGAPVTNESGKLEGEVDTEKGDDISERGSQEVESKCGGSAYNLEDQAKVRECVGQMGSAKVLRTHLGTAEIASNSTNIRGETEGFVYDPVWWEEFLQPMAPYMHEHDGSAFMDHQNTDVFFGSNKRSDLLSCSDVDGQLLLDYNFSACDGNNMLREMLDAVKDCQGVERFDTELQENATLQADFNALLDGDFLELDDMKTPLHGYESFAPIERSDLVNVEKNPLSEEIRGSFEEKQDVLCSQRVGAHNDRLQDVQSLTRSYVSKQESTYAVLKHEIMPAQLCYASSFTDRPHHGSATALTIESEVDVAKDAGEILPVTPMDSSSPPSLLIKTSNSIGRDASATLPLTSTSSLSDLPSSPNGSSSDVEAPLASQLCKSQAESANTNSPHRHMWKRLFRWPVSKKGSVLGARVTELEDGMRAKFNDKMLALRKSAAQGVVVPMEYQANTYDQLRKRVVATLCHLVLGVLIIFCVIWGYHILARY